MTTIENDISFESGELNSRPGSAMMSDDNVNDSAIMSDNNANRPIIISDNNVNESAMISDNNVNRPIIISDNNANRPVIISDNNVNESAMISDNNVNRPIIISNNNANKPAIISDDNVNESAMMSDDFEYENISKKLNQIEQEAIKLREMQTEVEKQFISSSSSTPVSPTAPHSTPEPTPEPTPQPTPQPNPQPASTEEKVLIDQRSVYVGNVDYSATPDQLEEHFRRCGPIERISILTDKFSGHPKGFAYIQFSDKVGMQTAISMSNTLFLGRKIKVTEKRTNRPGISTTNRPPRGRGQSRMIIKYIYPSRDNGGYSRRRFSPY